MQTLIPLFGLPSGGEILILLPGLIALGLQLWAIIDIAKSNFKGNNKIIWLLLAIFVPCLGPILYIFIGRKQRV